MTDQQLERIFEELKRRGALRALQRFLNEHDVASARSWDELKERTKQAIADKDLDAGAFEDFFIQVQLTAYKSYGLYEVGAKERAALVKYFAKLKTNNAFAKNYPYPVSRTALTQAAADPVPVSVQDTASGTALILCSPRRYFSRLEIPRNHLEQSVRHQYTGARLFADTAGLFQAYDVIFVSKNENYIQVRTDLGADRLEEDAATLQASITDALVDIIEAGKLGDLPSQVDLFPAIRSMYDDSKEGRVSELHFECTTGANRRESMRRQSAGDLRTESYHVAGKKAIKDIAPYRISVAWNAKAIGLSGDHEIEAHLPGTLQMLNTSVGLYRCYLPGLPTEDEVEFMLSRVLHHV